MIIGMDIEELSQETREWTQVMMTLRSTSRSVALDDLHAIGLSGLEPALQELEDGGFIHVWGGSSGVYVDMLWI
jgi:hypothetical protein